MHIRSMAASVAQDEVLRVEHLASGDEFCCVYVVAGLSGRPAKIGKAASPIARLAGLQTGNPFALAVHHLFWMRLGHHHLVEREAHAIAGSRHDRLIGEWFSCNADEAAHVVEDACELLGVEFFSRLPLKKAKSHKVLDRDERIGYPEIRIGNPPPAPHQNIAGEYHVPS